jgi:hypothetical protein
MFATQATFRDVIIGKHSTIWRELLDKKLVPETFTIALSHRDVSRFPFTDRDRVWVFSYSIEPEQNEALLKVIQNGKPAEVVYVSSATTNIAAHITCYRYPRTKLQAEQSARRLTNARILTLGVMYHDATELPGGETMATSYGELSQFLQHPHWPKNRDQHVLLCSRVQRPFSSVERRLFAAYGLAISLCAPWPCLLRPIDSVLRLVGYRWYGYVFLSNRQWSTTTS